LPKKCTGKSEASDVPFAHGLLNQLAIIVGHCDLLKEELQNTKCVERLELIQTAARAIAEELKTY
jgi:hypothetical protein